MPSNYKMVTATLLLKYGKKETREKKDRKKIGNEWGGEGALVKRPGGPFYYLFVQ